MYMNMWRSYGCRSIYECIFCTCVVDAHMRHGLWCWAFLFRNENNNIIEGRYLQGIEVMKNKEVSLSFLLYEILIFQLHFIFS